MADVIDLINYANENKPLEFNSAFQDLMGQRVIDTLQAAKQAVAMNMFSTQNTQDEQEEPIQSDEIDRALSDTDVQVEPVEVDTSEEQ